MFQTCYYVSITSCQCTRITWNSNYCFLKVYFYSLKLTVVTFVCTVCAYSLSRSNIPKTSSRSQFVRLLLSLLCVSTLPSLSFLSDFPSPIVPPERHPPSSPILHHCHTFALAFFLPLWQSDGRKASSL